MAASWAVVVTAGPLPWSMAVASCSSSEDASSPELSSSSLQERKEEKGEKGGRYAYTYSLCYSWLISNLLLPATYSLPFLVNTSLTSSSLPLLPGQFELKKKKKDNNKVPHPPNYLQYTHTCIDTDTHTCTHPLTHTPVHMHNHTFQFFKFLWYGPGRLFSRCVVVVWPS